MRDDNKYTLEELLEQREQIECCAEGASIEELEVLDYRIIKAEAAEAKTTQTDTITHMVMTAEFFMAAI